MKKISFLHPFSAKAVGLKESDLLHSHSKPQVFALQAFVNKNADYSFEVDYFTGSLIKKQKEVNGVSKRFWPISAPVFKRHQWRNQYSESHYRFYKNSTPDCTIINMSGHGSKYIFKLAKRIKQNNKVYIAMIGGLHMSYHKELLEYYQNAHHIIVHTEYQKKELHNKLEFAKMDIRVLPLGIDTNIFKPVEAKSNTHAIVTYVGRISRLKQVELAIQAVAYCNKMGKATQLKIIGPESDSGYVEELKAVIAELKCEQNVQFLGTVAHQNLVSHYQESTVLVLPSKHESFGMVMTEAMACGVPVIALKGAGGPDEIITHNVDGILVQEKDYHIALFALLSDEKHLNLLRINSRKKIETKFSLERTVKLLEEFITNSILI